MPHSEPKPQTWFIKPSINPNFEYARQHCLDWVLKFKFVKKNDRNYQRLEISKIWMLTARAYPWETKEELCFATEWFTWLFCHDDICDDSQLRDRPDSLLVLHNEFMVILLHKKMPGESGPLHRGLLHIREQLDDITTEKWIATFCEDVRLYLNATRWEAKNRMYNTINSVSSYNKMRLFSGAVYTCFDLIGMFHQIDADVSFLKDLPFRQMITMANNRVCWDNDIRGVAKELKEGTTNLITCLKHEHNISIEEAIEKAQKMCDIEMEDYFEFKERLPKFEKRKSLQQYTAGLESLVQGHIDWYSDTERYTVKN